MKDWHTHIGLYNNTYYDYHDVFSAMKKNGVDEAVCAYFTPLFDNEKNALNFYFAVVEELKKADAFGSEIGMKADLLYWADPLVMKQRTLQEIFSDFNYYGIALHPRLHQWTGLEKNHLEEILGFAQEKKLPVFIHTGEDDLDAPMQFEPFIKEFPDVEIHLAHCKKKNEIIELFSKYKNLYGDTAFCQESAYKAICDSGFSERMFFGTDFPITHWIKKDFKTEKYVDEEILTTEYSEALKENSYNK